MEDGLLALPDAVLSKVVFKEEAPVLPHRPQSLTSAKALSEAMSSLNLQAQHTTAEESEVESGSPPPPPPMDPCLAPLRFRHTHRVTLHLPDGPTPAALHFVQQALPHLAQLVQVDCTGALTRQLIRLLSEACPGLQRLHLSPTGILPGAVPLHAHSGSLSSSSNSSSRSSGRSSSPRNSGSDGSDSDTSGRSSDTVGGVVISHHHGPGPSSASSHQHLHSNMTGSGVDGAGSVDDSDSPTDSSLGAGSDSDCSGYGIGSNPTSKVPGSSATSHNMTDAVGAEHHKPDSCSSRHHSKAPQHANGAPGVDACASAASSLGVHASSASSNASAATSSTNSTMHMVGSSKGFAETSLTPGSGSGGSTSLHSHRTPSRPAHPSHPHPHPVQHNSTSLPLPTAMHAPKGTRRRTAPRSRSSSTFFLHPSDLRAFSHLRQLRMEPTDPRILQSLGSVEIAALGKLPALQSLVLLSPLWQMLPQLRDVSPLRGCTGLRHLQLGRIDTSSVGFRLPSLCHLSSLHVLQLGIGGMVDGVAETIGSGLPLLRCLQLTTTRPLGQSGWQALGSLTGLRTLNLAAPAEHVVPLLQPPEKLLPGSFAVLHSLRLQLLRWFGKGSQGLEIRNDVLSTLLPLPSLRVLLLAEGFAVDDSLAANLAPQPQDASPGRLSFLAVQGVARLSWRGLCGLLDSTGATHVQLGLSSQLLEDNRLPGLLEDRRVLQPGSSLLLKRSSLTLELLISYSSSSSSSTGARASSNLGSKETGTDDATSQHRPQSSSHNRHVLGHASESATATTKTS
ncbi:MAG: hypothetical protein WDW38_000107 [Sanguina aurantia]